MTEAGSGMTEAGSGIESPIASPRELARLEVRHRAATACVLRYSRVLSHAVGVGAKRQNVPFLPEYGRD